MVAHVRSLGRAKHHPSEEDSHPHTYMDRLSIAISGETPNSICTQLSSSAADTLWAETDCTHPSRGTVIADAQYTTKVHQLTRCQPPERYRSTEWKSIPYRRGHPQLLAARPIPGIGIVFCTIPVHHNDIEICLSQSAHDEMAYRRVLVFHRPA